MGYKEETSTWTGLFGILNAVAKFYFWPLLAVA
jgi:hypothetical protein